MNRFLYMACIVGLAFCVQGTPYAEVRTDIAYRAAEPLAVLDLYYPKTGTAPHPTHIFIHGGGWRGGTKRVSGLAAELFERLAEQRFLGVSVEYRKVNASKNIYMRESTVDALDAVRYVVAHADELGVDPQRVFVWGGSAGGHLALMAATTINNSTLSELPDLSNTVVQIRGAMAWYPPCDMENYETISVEKNGKLRPLSDRMGHRIEEAPAAYREISPFHNLSADCPPVLIFHGDRDLIVNVEHSVRFKQKADQVGGDCILQIVHNSGHGFTRKTIDQDPSIDEILKAAMEFFTGHCDR